MVASPKAGSLDQASPAPLDLGKKSWGSGKLVVHALLLIYAAVLTYVVGGLVFRYNVNPDIFFGLSFALLFFALGQCVYELGIPRAVLFFLITTVVGFGVEVLGTNTGLPFGRYYYGDFLGEKVFGVPIVVPLVWFVISYIAFSIVSHSRTTDRVEASGGRKSDPLSHTLALIIVASLGAVAWDLMVDPMFSTYGYWTWEIPTSVPSLSGVPLTNFLGWFVVAFIMLAIFVAATKRLFSSSNPATSLRRAPNTVDSRIAYALLMVDAAVANATLDGHYIVVVIGVAAMCSFLLFTAKPLQDRCQNEPKTR